MYELEDVDAAYGRYLGTLRQYLLERGWYEYIPSGCRITTGHHWSHGDYMKGCVEVTLEEAFRIMRFGGEELQ